MIRLIKKLFLFCVVVAIVGGFFLYRSVYSKKFDFSGPITFEINQGESIASISARLEEMKVVSRARVLQKYIAWKKLDRSITHGTITIDHAMTIAQIAELLATDKTSAERTVTIIPGSTLRDIAHYFEKEGIATEADVYELLGKPAVYQKPAYAIDSSRRLFDGKPETVSLEGYMAPETFNVFANATLSQIIEKFISHRTDQIQDFLPDIEKSGMSVYEVLTLASVLEKEVRSPEDRKIVADIFLRRLAAGWALQADSTVHYIVGTDDSVFTTARDRDTDSLWNTYKYPGLPAGPISTPSVSSLEAVLHPTANNYWYFLTTLDTGEVKYAKTLDEHNVNVATYLR